MVAAFRLRKRFILTRKKITRRRSSKTRKRKGGASNSASKTQSVSKKAMSPTKAMSPAKAMSPPKADVKADPKVKKMTQKVKPPPPTNEDVVTPRTRLRMEDKIMAGMGIWTCQQIREKLDSETTLTEEVKVEFIRANIHNAKYLKTWVKKQHFGLKDLSYYTKAGKAILNDLGNRTHEMYDIMFESSDLKDTDCIHLAQIVSKYEEKKNKEEKEKYDAELAKLPLWKRGAYKAANATYTTAAYVGTTVKSVASAVGSGIVNGAQLIWSWAKKYGFRLWTWIAKNPQTAYFTLLLLKQLKLQACRAVGKSFGWLGGQASAVRSGLNALILSVNPDYVAKASSSMSDLWSRAKDVYEFSKDKIVIKSVGVIADKMFKYMQDNLTVGLGATLGIALSFAFPPATVGYAMAGLTSILSSVIGIVKDDVKQQTEKNQYLADANNAFAMLFDVANPMECLRELSNEGFSYMNKDVESDEIKMKRTEFEKDNEARLQQSKGKGNGNETKIEKTEQEQFLEKAKQFHDQITEYIAINKEDIYLTTKMSYLNEKIKAISDSQVEKLLTQEIRLINEEKAGKLKLGSKFKEEVTKPLQKELSSLNKTDTDKLVQEERNRSDKEDITYKATVLKEVEQDVAAILEKVGYDKANKRGVLGLGYYGL